MSHHNHALLIDQRRNTSFSGGESHSRKDVAGSLQRGARYLLFALLLISGIGLCVSVARLPPAEVEIAGYATSLVGRTPKQRRNARLAAEAINGKTIPAGAVFSFNKSVQSWSIDRGYVKAPVSFDGELIPAFGGGVCQTSTTLYNAALLAGLPILERHPHVFAPHYVAPGRDAAVAHPSIDLRFRNPYPWAIRLRAKADGEKLEVRVIAPHAPDTTVRIGLHVLSTEVPARLTRNIPRYKSGTLIGHAYGRSPGATGYRVVATRVLYRHGKEIQRERLSDNSYAAMNRVVWVNPELPQ